MHYISGRFRLLETEPEFGLNYLQRIPVVVSTPNRVRDYIKYWLGDEGFRNFIDLTMWSGQRSPGVHQSPWVDGRIGDGYWRGKEWFDIWKEMLQNFERIERSRSYNYFILLLTPVPYWTDNSEQGNERHCLLENRTVYETFNKNRGWDPDRQIVIWQADAVFTP